MILDLIDRNIDATIIYFKFSASCFKKNSSFKLVLFYYFMFYSYSNFYGFLLFRRKYSHTSPFPLNLTLKSQNLSQICWPLEETY